MSDTLPETTDEIVSRPTPENAAPETREIPPTAPVATQANGEVNGASEEGVAIEGIGEVRDVEPWPEPVDANEVFHEVKARIHRHVSVHEAAANAIVLWIIFTHASRRFETLPMLAVLSPTRGCGKSTLLKMLQLVVRRPRATVNITEAALFRMIDLYDPTLLMDEVDRMMGRINGMLGVLNAGHQRSNALVWRVVRHFPFSFYVACPKAVAGIGSLPNTLMQRSIEIHMRRCSPTEVVTPLTGRDDGQALKVLSRKAARWVRDNWPRLDENTARLPGGLRNRAADNWKPLMSIAQTAGGEWPERAAQAALELSQDDDDSDAHGEMLLQDLSTFVRSCGTERVIGSNRLVEHLTGLEGRPWPEMMNGRPISATRLALMLRAFDIRPELVRDGDRVFRGYRPEAFRDAFDRYTT